MDHVIGGQADAERHIQLDRPEEGMAISPATHALFIHGAGHTAAVWRKTQAALSYPSLAVDLPGRAGKAGDFTNVSVEAAADSVAADAEANTEGDLVLIGHSVAGAILPSVANRLGGRVRHLVFVAGVAAQDGQLPAEVFSPNPAAASIAQLEEMRMRYRGMAFENLEPALRQGLDGLNFSCQPMRWANVPTELPRTFVRCLQDSVWSSEAQSRFIANCRAQKVVDIDTGHTPAIEAPVLLASVLDHIIASVHTKR